jgi:multidrug transporter EmrE-like cation transporter
MQLIWLGVAVTAAAGYHVLLKLTPAGVNPYLFLAVIYAAVTVSFAIAYVALPGPGAVPLREALGQLNWTAPVLGLIVVFLDLAFLMIYRGGFEVSLGQIVTQSGTALLLLLIGTAFFGEKLSPANIGGILLCIVGLWLISRR